MVFPKAAALTLLSFGLATRVTAVTTCAGLIEAVGSASTVTLEGNFACSEPITIYSGGMVTVAGPYTITIDADFAVGTLSSLFVTEAGGALTLNGLTIKSGAMGGIRAVHNEGALTVVDCTFSSLSGTAETMLSTGGVVSSWSRARCMAPRSRSFVDSTASPLAFVQFLCLRCHQCFMPLLITQAPDWL